MKRKPSLIRYILSAIVIVILDNSLECDDSVKHATYVKDSVSQSMIYTRAGGEFGRYS